MIIICNGTCGETGKIENLNINKFIETFEINFFSVIRIIKYYIKFFNSRKKIIIFSGGGAFSAFPKFDAYASSKTALVRLVENISAEYKSEIQINAIAPGFNFTKIQKKLIQNNTKNSIGEDYYKFLIKNKNKKNNFFKIFNLINKILFDEKFDINGKTISVNYDKWEKNNFIKKIKSFKNKDSLNLRRINIK